MKIIRILKIRKSRILLKSSRMMNKRNKMKIWKYYKRKKRILCILRGFNVNLLFLFFLKKINSENLHIRLSNISDSKQ